MDPPLQKKARWSHKELYKEVYWPQDLLPKVMPRARILTWGYDVQIEHIFSQVSKATVFQHAETLLLDISTLRRTEADQARPIIFISHSLGGIIVKEALSLSKNEKTFLKEVLLATAGVCFLGTPHRGSKSASLGKLAFGLTKALFQNPNLQILRALEINSEILECVGRSFCQIMHEGKISVHSFREELATKGVMIVDDFSSSIGDANETRGTIHANHRNIARFTSLEDPGFTRVTSVLLRWENDLQRKTHKKGQPVFYFLSGSSHKEFFSLISPARILETSHFINSKRIRLLHQLMDDHLYDGKHLNVPAFERTTNRVMSLHAKSANPRSKI